MMTNEEYQKNLIRMWDSIRSDCKGENNCKGVSCVNCPLFKKVCRADINTVIHCYKAIKIVEEWAKEHPVQTNAEKFEEVFGVDAPMNRCIKNDEFCADCEYYEFGSEHGGCKVDERFWEAEYKGGVDGE